ncbi:MAG: double-strand break repair helicase AddA [Pseudomonadota bacterium]
MAEAPTPEQRLAADPARSAWVGANAGSGKTRVLTHRVARLLLAGSRPERILCLTYTKAAAAEMQGRLFKLLGEWSMASDAALSGALRGLGGGSAAPAPERLVEARRLFAEALETPGGLRIQTIHAFCEQLLRRFPLEAGVSPRFRVVDDRHQAALGAAVSRAQGDAAARGESDVIDRVAARAGEHALDALQAAVSADRHRFPSRAEAVEGRLAAHYPASALAGEEAAVGQAIGRLDWPALAALAAELEGGEGKRGHTAAERLRFAARRHAAGDDLGAFDALTAALLSKDKETGLPAPKSETWLISQADETARPGLRPRMTALAESVADALAELATARMAARAGDLNAFAADWLMRYAAAKARGGLLDFTDLVGRAAGLLTAPGLAPWVLWKLDGGIEHILVDEAQDTSPEQWAVIAAIAAEFHAGESARAATRTLFAVGDEKQSIYSFQGADPAVFAERRAGFRAAFAPHGSLAEPALERSFRSAPGILDFVDRVFAGEAASGLVADGTPPRHVAHHEEAPATIDFWAAIPGESAEKETAWWEPVDRPSPGRAEIRLAHRVAAEISRMVREDMLPGRAPGEARAMGPGDVLVLVRRRSLLFHTIVRRLKAEGVPVAGADRITLVEELAVQDLLAALKVAAHRDDDLSLACLLRSPLCDVSEEGLFALAHGRAPGERLWRRLLAAEADHPRTTALFRDLEASADFARPYELLERLLTRHDGRARLLARIGGEAEDAIDELLTQSLAYEAEAAPSLAGFIDWVETGALEAKRQMGEAGGEVRVMTVHGAKGLEAPVVILPDTLGKPGGGGAGRPTLLPVRGTGNAPDLMLWAEGKGQDDALARQAREAAQARETAEFKRLLYVALTRAESRLLICGAGSLSENAGGDPSAPLGSKGAADAAGWYHMVERAVMGHAEARAIEPPDGVPAAWRIGIDPARRASGPATQGETQGRSRAPGLRPSWLRPAPEEPRRLRITPSALAPEEPAPTELPEGPTRQSSPAPREREAALLHGIAVHHLLEHLPPLPAAAREAAGRRMLAEAVPALDDAAREAALAEAARVFDAPFAAKVFSPGSVAEASIGGPFGAGEDLPPLFLGRIDRLLIAPDQVLAIDYKTDARPPASNEIPAGYRAQLGAYAAALSRIYPDRAVKLAILWTAIPRLDAVNPASAQSAFDAALTAHRQGAA